jgi:hypothetical protein
MPTPKTRTEIALAASLATALIAALVLLFAASSASAAACGRIGVGVSKHRVKPGQFVRVSGTTCSEPDERPDFVRIKLRTKRGWRQVGTSHTHRSGRFSRRIRVPAELPAAISSATTKLQVTAPSSQSPSVPIQVEPEQEAEDTNCPLKNPGYEVEGTIEGCPVVASDTASNANPIPFWGRIDCGIWPELNPSQATRPETGGDTHLTATGIPQENEAFREMTVYDGDDVAGERCELGLNDMDSGPTSLFSEGMRRVTYFSERLPENFDLEGDDWQTVFQMKQDQPSVDNGGGPMIELQATRGQWILANDWDIRWTFPAQKNVWTRFAFDVVYSQDASKGSIQVSADLNDDGDFNDANERSPKIHTATLSTETEPGYEIPPGGSIPSHIRAGIYHNTNFSCPRPVGCSTQLDNLQVVAP